MISSASSPNRASRADALSATGPVTPRPLAARPDRISTESASFLRAELVRQPEVRAEVVARGRELAADPTYPRPAIIGYVARQILATPDLSNDES